MARKRLAVARLWHEGNSFTPTPTTRADFARREWVSGEAARRFYSGTRTELGAAIDFVDAHRGWEGVFLRCCAAPPGGPVEAGLLDQIHREIVGGLEGGRWDAVYVSLHGALIGEDWTSPERDLLAAVRAAVGDAPVAVTFDLHANLDPALAGLADIVVGYKTYPHVDMYETAEKALGLLEKTVGGEIAPVCRIVKAGAVLASHNMQTTDGPMAEAEALARELEAPSGLLDVTPFGGFAYADVPAAGAGAAATADGDAALAERAAAELAGFLHHRRRAFRISLPGPDAAIDAALSAAAGRPVAVLEPSDNPLSGGIGDATGLFAALLRRTPPGPTAFAFFADRDLVARCRAAGVGAGLRCRLGGRLSGDFGEPVEVEAVVSRLTDGRFVNRGPMERGLAVDLGPTAVLEAGPIDVIVTESCQAPNDPAYFDLHGIAPGRLRLLCAKAKNHFRAAFGDVFAVIVEADTPGPAALDPGRLPFRRVPRKLLPTD